MELKFRYTSAVLLKIVSKAFAIFNAHISPLVSLCLTKLLEIRAAQYAEVVRDADAVLESCVQTLDSRNIYKARPNQSLQRVTDL